jgi:hypothetical protein
MLSRKLFFETSNLAEFIVRVRNSVLDGIADGVSMNYVRQRVNDAVDTVSGHESYIYFDSLGRPMQSRAEAENGQSRVSGTVYDQRGNPKFATLPHFSSSAEFTKLTGTHPGTEELLAAVNAQAGDWHYGEELRESDQAKAERIVTAELKRRKGDAGTLAERRKGDPAKVAIARRLREETTMTLAWIAERLAMGTKTHLAHLFYWERRRTDLRSTVTASD